MEGDIFFKSTGEPSQSYVYFTITASPSVVMVFAVPGSCSLGHTVAKHLATRKQRNYCYCTVSDRFGPYINTILMIRLILNKDMVHCNLLHGSYCQMYVSINYTAPAILMYIVLQID
ncbi:hypothetical protein DPEC_G00157710 [Dallia pectoralis]|uniref:Uncharacterized protein n=1 Tax=Dallia pectoralis TaxID=75939 RepID=A0ACC2GKZ0_DALPE|nr:hypothetical protein DPEC_G00157710 [Dallia pectoralis]